MHEDLLNAIDTFYDCAENGFDHQRAISVFSRTVDDTGLCLVDIQLDGNFKLLAFENMPPESMSIMINGPWQPEGHGILRNFAKIPVGVPVLHRAVESDEEFYSSDLYKRAFAPWGLHSVGLCLLKKSMTGGVLNGFLRNPEQDELNPELLSRITVLNKHLWRAMRLRGRADRIEAALIKANNVLDLIEFGLVLFGADGSMVFANAAARRIFDRRDGLTLEKNGIAIADRAAQRQFHELLGALTRPETPLSARAGAVVQVPRPALEKPYSLLAVPMNASNPALDNVGVAFLLFDPSAKPTTAIDLFAASYNLTRTEARLAAELARGVSLDEYSQRQGVTRNTVKTHLRSIFAKTDTSRQSELVGLLLRSLAGIRLSPDHHDTRSSHRSDATGWL